MEVVMHTLPTWTWFVLALGAVVGVVYVIAREITHDIWRDM
jgi:hypothetical protein